MSSIPFSLAQLRILKAIAAQKNFKRAADSLDVSPTTVSIQMQNLEKQLNVSLFQRVGRKAQLTQAGQLLVRYGEQILTSCLETCHALEDLQNRQGRTLRVGASQTTGTYLLPRLIGWFHQKYPDVAVQLPVHSTKRICWALANGEVDLAIIGGEVPAELQDSLRILASAEDEIALILPVFHKLAPAPAIDQQDLYKLKFITLDSQSSIRQVIDNVLMSSDVATQRLQVEMELNSIEAIKNAVSSGLGAAFVSVKAIEKELRLGILQRAHLRDVELKRTLSLVINPNRYRNHAAESFIREILPEFSSQCQDLEVEQMYQTT